MSILSGSNRANLLKRGVYAAGRLLRQIGKRSYALVLILIILWLSWRAIFYLVAALILPSRPPAQIVDIPTRLNQAVLIRSQTGDKGELTIAHNRSPLSHYHRLDKGFQSDPLNGCTISQCHAPLPHGKNKADRAFLNMHSTSIHCAVCHTQTDQKPLPLTWYDLNTGATRGEAPALLRAYAWLTSPLARNTNAFTIQEQAEIVRLLRAAANEAGGETELGSLADHLAAVRATSEEFRRLLPVTREACRGHFRGDYGAKLALVDPRTRKASHGNPSNEKAVRDYLARRNILTDAVKKTLVKNIHPQQRDPTLHCAACHRPEGSLVDFGALGYPPARIQAISSPLVTSAIDHIVEGKPFYLPGFLEIKDER